MGLRERASPAQTTPSNDGQVGEASSSESHVGSVPDSVERPSSPGPGPQVTGRTAEGLPLLSVQFLSLLLLLLLFRLKEKIK